MPSLGQQRCRCAATVFRNHADGSRDYQLRGNLLCMSCRGSGMTLECPRCGGAGMLPGSQICGECRGEGRVAAPRAADA